MFACASALAGGFKSVLWWRCSKRERVEVFISDLALVLVTGSLYRLGAAHGWLWLAATYGIPYLVVNHFLVRQRPNICTHCLFSFRVPG